MSDDPATAEFSEPHELVRSIEAGIASGTDVHAHQLELMAWVAAPEGEAPAAEVAAHEAGASEAATDDAGAEANKPPSPVKRAADLVKEIELLRTAGALANRDALRKAQLRLVTWILSPGGLADVPLSLGLQAARVEDMGPRNQRTLKSWACNLFTALAQLLKAGTPAVPSAVLTLIRQVIGPRAEVVGRTHVFEVSFAEALKRAYACWKVKGLGQRGWFRQLLSIPAAVFSRREVAALAPGVPVSKRQHEEARAHAQKNGVGVPVVPTKHSRPAPSDRRDETVAYMNNFVEEHSSPAASTARNVKARVLRVLKENRFALFKKYLVCCDPASPAVPAPPALRYCAPLLPPLLLPSPATLPCYPPDPLLPTAAARR